MPERTTPKQRMIALVRQHLAQPGVTVTESKRLLDQASGQLREVDVVAEGELDGEQLIVSVEVVDRTRKATLTWVDEMVGKHMTMPTNQLVLVSWSGFSRPALAKVTALPRVSAVTPTPVLEPDGSQRYTESLYVDQITLTAERLKVKARAPGGQISDFVPVGKEIGIYNEDGDELGAIAQLADLLLKNEEVGRRFGGEAHGREDREDVTWFTFRSEDIGGKLFLRTSEVVPPELHRIEAIEIVGTFAWQQTELKFAIVDINGRAHGIAQAPMLGKDAVWVATAKDGDSDEVNVSWRTMNSVNPDEG
jgi:hypothetical protein